MKILDLFQSICHIQAMSKASQSLKALELRAVGALLGLLQSIPVIEIVTVQQEPEFARLQAGAFVMLKAGGRPHALICTIKSSGQPRYVHAALQELQLTLREYGKAATPILIAPYLSPLARALCRQHNVGYLDMEGNAWIAFGGIFIERQVADTPLAERRELQSLFSPKSGLVLRAMLRQPGKIWRVTELAAATGVSLGHISNVRTGLLDREWASATPAGLFLAEPDALLDAWQHSYQPPAGERQHFYTPLHGSAFEDAARHVLSNDAVIGRAVFSSFSAGHWLSPYARTGLHYFYADKDGLQSLIRGLELSPVEKGENVVITIPKEAGVLSDTLQAAPGAICTSPVQTYLDLSVAGERGMEAARHLRQAWLTWR